MSGQPSDIPVVRAGDAGDAGPWLARFDIIYRESGGAHENVPWAHKRVSPTLRERIERAERDGEKLLPPGGAVCVTGVGLGDDALWLAGRGYLVTGMDVAPEAIRLAGARRGMEKVGLVRADLLDAASLGGAGLVGRFDAVCEVHTVQSLPVAYRERVCAGIASLLKPGGVVIAVARGRDEAVAIEDVEGPPFAFTAAEFGACFASAGLAVRGAVEAKLDGNAPAVVRLCGVFEKRAG